MNNSKRNFPPNRDEILAKVEFAIDQGATLTNEKGEILKRDRRKYWQWGNAGGKVGPNSCECYLKNSGTHYYYSNFTTQEKIFFDGFTFDDWLKAL